jgi:hypothetical protein
MCAAIRRHRESVERAPKRRVMVELRAVARRILVPGREPGVGVRDVHHAHHAELLGKRHLLEPQRATKVEQPRISGLGRQFGDARRIPELHRCALRCSR